MSDPNSQAVNAAPLDMNWAEDELVPFLQSVFSDQRRPAHAWMGDIHFARYNMDKIPFYEDFPLTIERLRLTLLNSDTLTAGELAKMRRATDLNPQMCIRIFVRHASRHGPYQLFSLGRNPSPDFPRGNQARNVRPAMRQAPAPSAPQTSAPALSQAPVPGVSYARPVDENAVLRERMGTLDLGAEGRREVGRGRATAGQTNQPSHPRGGYNGRPDRGYYFNQGARIPPAVQQTLPQYTPDPFCGFNLPYGGPSYMYDSYLPAPSIGGHGMQQYGNPPPYSYGVPPLRPYGEWDANQWYHNTQQSNSSQSGASSGYMMPPPQTTLVPQQFRSNIFQGQVAQQVPGASAGQQARAQNQGRSAPAQQHASAAGSNDSVLHPDARPFTPGSSTTDD